MLSERIKGFQHLGLPVTSIETSRAFYERLGFREAMTRTLPTQDGVVQVAMMELNGFVLELYQLVGAALEEIRTRGHGHIDHVALDVDDINAVFQMVQEIGLQPLEEAPIFLPFWERGVYYFNVQGPDGEKVEFNQRL